MDEPPASHRYYFVTGEGSWRGEFFLSIHDRPAFRRDSIGFWNRLFVLSLLLLQKVLGRPQLTSHLRAFPDLGVNGVATNILRIKKLGLTLYLLKEQYVMSADGSSVYIHAFERRGPIPFLFRTRKHHPAHVAEDGLRATYRKVPLLGTTWRGEYEVDRGGDHIDATFTCPWASASEIITRRGSRSTPRPARTQPVGRDLSDLSDVISALERQRDWYDAVRDRRAVFTHAYAHITREFEERLLTEGFDDPAWIVALDLAFAAEYLNALDAFDLRGELPPGWSKVFDAMDEGRTSVLEELILSMAAHLVNDLPRALVAVLPDSADEDRVADYHRANDVLESAIDGIQQTIARRYNPIIRCLDQAIGRDDEVLTNYGIRLARAAAWFNAERLRKPETEQSALESVARSTDVLVRQILRPPLKSLRVLLRVARWIIRKWRIWPGRQIL